MEQVLTFDMKQTQVPELVRGMDHCSRGKDRSGLS